MLYRQTARWRRIRRNRAAPSMRPSLQPSNAAPAARHGLRLRPGRRRRFPEFAHLVENQDENRDCLVQAVWTAASQTRGARWVALAREQLAAPGSRRLPVGPRHSCQPPAAVPVRTELPSDRARRTTVAVPPGRVDSSPSATSRRPAVTRQEPLRQYRMWARRLQFRRSSARNADSGGRPLR